MNDIEGLRQRAVRSDLDFHYLNGANLDMVNVASPTPCVRLRILQDCFSLCTCSYPLPVFRNSERTSFHPFHLFPVLDVHPSQKYHQHRLPRLPLSMLPFLSSLLYHIAPRFLTSKIWTSMQTSLPGSTFIPQQTHICTFGRLHI